MASFGAGLDFLLPSLTGTSCLEATSSGRTGCWGRLRFIGTGTRTLSVKYFPYGPTYTTPYYSPLFIYSPFCSSARIHTFDSRPRPRLEHDSQQASRTRQRATPSRTKDEVSSDKLERNRRPPSIERHPVDRENQVIRPSTSSSQPRQPHN